MVLQHACVCVCLSVCLSLCVYARARVFQVPQVQEVVHWYSWLDSLSLTVLTGLDCKEQFDRIKPQWITEQMRTGSAWLYRKNRWRSSNLV